MADYFYWSATTAFLTGTGGLAATDIAAVTSWQNTALDYEFSLHTMHTAGWPIYVVNKTRAKGGRGEKNMPKLDTKGKTAAQLAFVNGAKLLDTQSADALAVVGANLALFQQLARNYYEGIPAPTVAVVETVQCKGSKCGKDITHVAAGDNGKRVCPHCKQWN